MQHEAGGRLVPLGRDAPQTQPIDPKESRLLQTSNQVSVAHSALLYAVLCQTQHELVPPIRLKRLLIRAFSARDIAQSDALLLDEGLGMDAGHQAFKQLNSGLSSSDRTWIFLSRMEIPF